MNASDIIRLIVDAVTLIGIGTAGFVFFAKWIGGRLTKITDAYAEERAKLKAQSDNLEKLVEETKELTRTAEGIKTQLSGEEWGRQQRMLKRWESYVAVIEALQNYQQAALVLGVESNSLVEFGKTVSPEGRELLSKRLAQAFTDYNAVREKWNHAFALVELCGENEAITVLRSFAIPSFTMDTIRDEMAKARKLAIMTRLEFIVVARQDLGYSTPS